MLLAMFPDVVPTKASNASYPTTIYSLKYTPNINGYWDTRTEWSDAASPAGLPASFAFRNKWSVAFVGGALKVYEWYLIEFFTDNTNDTGDWVQICYDSNATSAAAPKGGANPDLRIDILGHNGTVKTYQGTGTGWAAAPVNDTIVAQTLNSSRLSSATHWITELRVEKQANGLGMNNGIRIAMYDASNPTAGVQAYPPPSQQDVPSTYSLNSYSTVSNLPPLYASAFWSVTVYRGWTWWFFAESSGGVAPVTSQWYENTTLLPGQTSMVFAVTKTVPGTYTFYCQFNDSEGQSVNSNTITLTVL